VFSAQDATLTSTEWRRLVERLFWPIVGTLLLAMCALELGAMHQDSAVYDEPYHILSGYKFLKSGTLQYGSEHPPLRQCILAFAVDEFASPNRQRRRRGPA